jgi:hypothetical protein
MVEEMGMEIVQLIRALRTHLPARTLLQTLLPHPPVQPPQPQHQLPPAMAEASTGVGAVVVVDADEEDVDAGPSKRAIIDLHSH